jgi:hypothetical protein
VSGDRHRGGEQAERRPVRRRPRHRLGGDAAGRAGAVGDLDGPPAEARPQRLGQDAGSLVGVAAGQEADQQAHRLSGGCVLRRRRRGEAHGEGGYQGGPGEEGSGHAGDLLPPAPGLAVRANLPRTRAKARPSAPAC